MDDLRINASVTISAAELGERFIRSSGPGGQNVNKVATKVQLRFDVMQSSALPAAARDRLLKLAGQRATQDGVIVIEAQSERSRERNRQEARDRLADLVRRALRRPKTRKATRPTRASREKRLDQKSRRSLTKQKRGRVRPPEDS